MSDKTCGTCQRLETHRTPLYGRFLCYYNVSIASNGVEIPNPRSEDDAACESWIERTDSLEAVARDMLALIRAAKQHPIVLKPNAIRGGQIMQPDPDNVSAERLEALGVEP